MGDIFLPHLAANFTDRNPYPSVHLMSDSHLAVVTASPAIEQIKNILKQKSLNHKSQIQNTFTFSILRCSTFCSLVVASVFFVLGIITSLLRVYLHNQSFFTPSTIFWAFAVCSFLFVMALSIFVAPVWIFTLGLSAMHLCEFARSYTILDKGSKSYHYRGFSLLINFIKTVGYSFGHRQLKFILQVLIQPDSRLEELLLHLGRISRLCFVDKKGIISLPIPTPEKLFFFRERQNRRRKAMRTRSLCPNTNSSINGTLLPPLPSFSSVCSSKNQKKRQNITSLVNLHSTKFIA